MTDAWLLVLFHSLLCLDDGRACNIYSMCLGVGMGRQKREELFISTKVYFKSLYPLRTIPTARLNQCHYPECLWQRERKGWTPTFTEQPTAMHRCISFNRRQTISWLQLCRNRAPRGQEMESGCIPRPTRHQDPWAPKLPVSPSPMLKHYPGLEGTSPFTCCFPYVSPHIISQPCRIAKNSFSTIINSCLVSKINSNLCEPAVT